MPCWRGGGGAGAVSPARRGPFFTDSECSSVRASSEWYYRLGAGAAGGGGGGGGLLADGQRIE